MNQYNKKTNYNANSANSKYNQGMRLITEHYKEPAQKLIKLLLEKHDYTLDEVSKLLGISRAAVQQNWLKPIKGEDK